MQNIIILIDTPFDTPWMVNFKAGIMGLNRFTIDEGAAFETSGVYHLQSSYSCSDLPDGCVVKGMEYICFH